jgi:hypothetical protein
VTPLGGSSVCPEVLSLDGSSAPPPAVDRQLTDWLEAAAEGLVCNALDGRDVLPLLGLLPPMSEPLEFVVDRLLIDAVSGRRSPLADALHRREVASAAAALDEAQAARVVAWSAEHDARTAERWCALARLVWRCDGSLASLRALAAERSGDGEVWARIAAEVEEVVEDASAASGPSRTATWPDFSPFFEGEW